MVALLRLRFRSGSDIGVYGGINIINNELIRYQSSRLEKIWPRSISLPWRYSAVWRRSGASPAPPPGWVGSSPTSRSEEPTSELQSLMRISYDVFCLKQTKKKH